MKTYKARQDVVLTKVCGEYLLVATKSAQEECPVVQHINGSAALLWSRMKTGATVGDLSNTMKKYFRFSKGDDNIEEDIRKVLYELKEAGYLQESEKTSVLKG